MADRPKPVTVSELRRALATYPDDALVHTGEAGTGMGTIDVQDGTKWHSVWDGVTSAGNWYGDEGEAMYGFFANHRPKGATDE